MSHGYNQLLVDDSKQQGRIQLKTTQAGSQLNLGYLIHNADNHRGSYRGQGLELRTDAWGALRAGAGWLLTSYPISHNANRRQAAADCPANWGMLNYAQTLSQSLSQLAQHHLSVALAAQLGSTAANTSHLDEKAPPLKALANTTQGMVDAQHISQAYADADRKNTKPGSHKQPQHTDPVIAIASRDYLSLSARQNLQFNCTETLNLINAGDSQSSTGGQWRIHSGQAIGLTAGGLSRNPTAGFQLIAAQGDTHLQAHNGQANIRSKEQLDIKSAHSHIDLAAAKHITLRTAAGACIEIKGGNITVQCPGKLTVHAGQKVFLGPTSKTQRLPVMPKSEQPKEKINFRLMLTDMPGNHGHPLPERPWKIVRLKGHTGDNACNPKQWRQIHYQGTSDGSGECVLDEAQKLTLWQEIHQNPQAYWLVSGANATPITLTLLAASAPETDAHKTLDTHNYAPSQAHMDEAGQKNMLRQWAENDYGTHLTATPKTETKT